LNKTSPSSASPRLSTAARVAGSIARARRVRRLSSEIELQQEVSSAPASPELEVEVDPGTWGPDAVKVAVFGDMGTAEVDGSYDAGHSNEPPSLGTMGILKDHLRGAKFGAGVGADAGGVEPQLGLVLHIGDLSYARGYDAQWDEVKWARMK